MVQALLDFRSDRTVERLGSSYGFLAQDIQNRSTCWKGYIWEMRLTERNFQPAAIGDFQGSRQRLRVVRKACRHLLIVQEVCSGRRLHLFSNLDQWAIKADGG